MVHQEYVYRDLCFNDQEPHQVQLFLLQHTHTQLGSSRLDPLTTGFDG